MASLVSLSKIHKQMVTGIAPCAIPCASPMCFPAKQYKCHGSVSNKLVPSLKF